MFVGFILLLAFLVAQHGTFAFLAARLPATHLTWHGGNPPGTILVWYFIALSALVDPAFWQRAFAARDPRTARVGVVVSVGFWMLFDFLTTSCGLYARALLPGLTDPVSAFPALANATLPPLALGLFYLGMIATVMSTIDSYAFIAATTLARDVWWRLRGGREDRLPVVTRVALWISAGVALALAFARPSVIALWKEIGSLTTPALLLPVGTALLERGRLPSRWTLAAMVVPFLVTASWLIAGRRLGAPAFGVEPIYAGLAASLALYASGWLVVRIREVPA
jgi:SSS family solute:Na+ symporter